MLLKSSLFILLLVNILPAIYFILSGILLVVLILNLCLNKNLKKAFKTVKSFINFFYLSTFLVQLYYGQQGKVLFKFYNFYLTQEGLMNFAVNFIRILNLILMSWLINEMKLLTGRFSKYQKIIDTVIV